MSSTLQRHKHIYELDYIRAISAIFIVLFHYTTQYDSSFGHIGNWPVAVPWGSRAVNTFFLLTGYLTLCHFRDGGLKFMGKRLIRLWPAFAVCVVITSVFMALLLPERLRTIPEILLNFTMFPAHLGARVVDGVYWTLPVEILFYFWIMLFMIKKDTHRLEVLLYIWCAISIAANLCNKLGFTPLPVKLLQILCITERAPCFILGAAIHLWEANSNRGAKAAVVPLVALCLVGIWLAQGLAVAIWTAAWALLIWAVVTGKLHFAFATGNPLHKCLLFLSEISYCLYLLHQFIGFAIIRKIESLGGLSELWIFVPVGVSLLLATAVHYWVEVPAGNFLKQRLLKPKKSA